MENNLYKEGIHIVSMNNNFYKNTRNNVLIISEKLYLSIHNNLYFFRNRLIIVNNRENFRRWYPVLCKSFKIFIVDDK